MLHLITHYGIVSNERVEKASKSRNKKKFILLSLRRSHTDEYLRQYNLQEIDCSLDETYPDPIGRRDRDAWYNVASEMLLNEFRRIDLKIDENLRTLYFTDEDGKRRCISYSFAEFTEFLMIATYTSKIFNYQLDWSKRELTNFVTSTFIDKRFRTNESQDIED